MHVAPVIMKSPALSEIPSARRRRRRRPELSAAHAHRRAVMNETHSLPGRAVPWQDWQNGRGWRRVPREKGGGR